MIDSKAILKEYLTEERSLYIDGGFLKEGRMRLSQNPSWLIWHYQKMLRLTEYHWNQKHRLRYFWYQRKKNREGKGLGITISPNTVGKGLLIYHYGSIVIHENARVGENCRLHGENCIGNKGDGSDGSAPVIGKNCEFGIGAKVLGGITLCDSVVVGANAVITKSVTEKGTVVAGVPGRVVNFRSQI